MAMIFTMNPIIWSNREFLTCLAKLVLWPLRGGILVSILSQQHRLVRFLVEAMVLVQQ